MQIQYENDFFEINKRISITHKSMEWNYHVTINNEKKLSEYEISLFVPLVVNDGRSALKVITEIGQGIIFQWHDLLYVLKYNHAVRAVFDTNLSLGSTSGVSSNYEIILPPPNGNSNHIECSIQLFLIKKEEINNYKCCEDEYAENGYFIDVVAGITGDCVGCGVCASLCPQKCITMQTDDAGFRYPIVDKNRCVGCNICNHRCPINHRPVVNAYTRPFVYAAYASDEENRKASSSGGVFGEFAKIMIENGGTVFAARYHPFPAVTFSKVNDIKSIQLFHGSKYVESKLDNIFAEVQKELNTGKNVLFVGLPCQIAGLLCFLQETYMNLYTIDLICGGVPSYLHFETWIHTLETLYQDQIIDYQFRNKTLGWHDNISSLTFSSGKKQFIEKKKDIFYQDYYKGNNVRKACFHCQFYGLKTVADITIGDFNGALNYDWLRKDADKGISVICINSEKGDRLVQLCKEKMVLRETNFLVASRYNHRMKKRRTEPCEREKYLKDIDLFKKRINSDFNPNALCFYKIENPPERVSKGTVMRWIVYVKGTKEIEYAWYLYHNGDRIHIAWYNEKNSFEYIPETDGEYYVVAFARYKGDQDTIFINLQKVMVI